jgi:hypothetical protein
MSLLNTKTLLVIASLLAAILGVLNRMESRQNAVLQQKIDQIQRDKSFAEEMEHERQKRPTQLGGFDYDIRHSKPF